MDRADTSVNFKSNNFVPLIIRTDKTKKCQPFESLLQTTKQKMIQYLPQKSRSYSSIIILTKHDFAKMRQ